MIFHYQKNKKTIEVLNDLIEIQNDRIAGYELVLTQSRILGKELYEEMKKILVTACRHKIQLVQKLSSLDSTAKTPSAFGKVYRLWLDLKVAFSCSSRKALLSTCQYNEEIALHVYNAALSIDNILPVEIQELVEQQEQALKAALQIIKSYKEVPHHSEMELLYLN